MMYKNKTKQYILAITLLAAFATGFECSNSEEEPVSRNTPGNNDRSSDDIQTPPPSSPQYSLEVTGLEPKRILGASNKCTIEITKTENGTVTTIDAAELGNLTLTATSDISDGTEAMLQGVDPLKLVNTDIKTGKIEKEVTINRGTAQTTFTITLTNGTGAVQGTATVIAPAGFPEYILELLDLQPGNILAPFGTCTIKITKAQPSGAPIPIDVTDLPTLALTATKDVNDATAAKLQGGVNALKLVNTDIKGSGTIEKEVSINRGTAQTTFTITLTHTATAVTSTATVVALSKLPDLSITLKAGESLVHMGSGEAIFKVEITSKLENIQVNQLGGITLRYNKDDSIPLSYMTKNGKPREIELGVTTLKQLLETNSVKELEKGVPTTLQFTGRAYNKPSATYTKIQLIGTADPDNAANYITTITYQKPNVTLNATQPAKGSKDFELTITTPVLLSQEDLGDLGIRYQPDSKGATLSCNGKDLEGTSLFALFGKNSLVAGFHTLKCKVETTAPTNVSFSDIRIQGSLDEATNRETVIYTP